MSLRIARSLQRTRGILCLIDSCYLGRWIPSLVRRTHRVSSSCRPIRRRHGYPAGSVRLACPGRPADRLVATRRTVDGSGRRIGRHPGSIAAIDPMRTDCRRFDCGRPGSNRLADCPYCLGLDFFPSVAPFLTGGRGRISGGGCWDHPPEITYPSRPTLSSSLADALFMPCVVAALRVRKISPPRVKAVQALFAKARRGDVTRSKAGPELQNPRRGAWPIARAPM
jgi:hypothetical protein